MSIRIQTISLGCPKNRVDTESILGGFGTDLVSVDDARTADVVLINTCGFIEPAVNESLEVILAAAQEISVLDPRPLLVVTGCLISRYGEAVFQELPEVDLFVPIARQQELAALVFERLQRRKLCAGQHVSHRGQKGNVSRLLTTPPGFAYLKIAEGCDNRCRFCTIPAIRGPLRSRPQSDILRDARQCLAAGRRELILVAQDVTAYGRDLSEASLPRLLKDLVVLPGLDWLRLMYLYPAGLTREMLAFLADLGPPFVPYFDIPLQHAHPVILRSMGRPFERDPRTVVEQVRAFFPQAALRTTVIVGYPGETEEHFRDLEAFVRETRFMHLGVFPYYPEEGSEAAKQSGQLADAVKEERRERLMALQAEISEEMLQEFVGQEMDVLVDQAHEEWPGLYEGRVWFQAPEVDGLTYVSGQGVATGRLVKAVIDEAKTYDLVALV